MCVGGGGGGVKIKITRISTPKNEICNGKIGTFCPKSQENVFFFCLVLATNTFSYHQFDGIEL